MIVYSNTTTWVGLVGRIWWGSLPLKRARSLAAEGISAHWDITQRPGLRIPDGGLESSTRGTWNQDSGTSNW